MYTVVIDKYALHFEVCLFAVLLILKFNESVLKAIAGTLISDDLAR